MIAAYTKTTRSNDKRVVVYGLGNTKEEAEKDALNYYVDASDLQYAETGLTSEEIDRDRFQATIRNNRVVKV